MEKRCIFLIFTIFCFLGIMANNYFDLIPGANKQVYVKTDLNEDDFRKKIKITILNNI